MKFYLAAKFPKFKAIFAALHIRSSFRIYKIPPASSAVRLLFVVKILFLILLKRRAFVKFY